MSFLVWLTSLRKRELVGLAFVFFPFTWVSVFCVSVLPCLGIVYGCGIAAEHNGIKY